MRTMYNTAHVLGCLIGVLLVTGTAARAVDDPITLVRDGQAVAGIVIATEATRSAQFAAYELQRHVKQITGAELPILTDEDVPAGPRVLVGASGATAAIGLTADDVREPQQYLVRFLPDTLVLMGNDADDKTRVTHDDNDPFSFETWPDFFSEHATCYAVYDFLERHCGVRWLLPNEVGTVIPAAVTLEVWGEDILRAPAFKYRQPGHMLGLSEQYDRFTGLWNPRTDDARYKTMDAIAWPQLDKKWPQYWDHIHAKRGQVRLFLHRMRAGGEPYAANHAFHGYYNRFWAQSENAENAKLFEGHRPELFASGYEGTPAQMCFTNPELVQETVADARRYFDGHGLNHCGVAAGDYFAVVPEDNNSWCKGSRCQAKLNLSSTNEQFTNDRASDLVFGFVNQVARQVGESHPDKTIATLGYWSYAYPPQFELEPNISVQFSLHIRNVFAKGIQENDLKLLRTWAEREPGRRFYVWLYYCFPVENALQGNWHCFPGFFAHQVARSFKLYHEMGVRGAFFNGFGQDVDAYVSFKLLDDPAQDVDALLDDYFHNLYGAAAEPMKRLYLRIEEIYSTSANYPPGFNSHQTREVAWGHLGTAEHMAELGTLMDRVRHAAVTELEKKRVALWEQGVWDYMVAGRQQYLRQEGIALRKLSVPCAAEPAGGDPGKVDWSHAAALDGWADSGGAPTDRKLAGRILHDGVHLYVELTEQVDPAKLESDDMIWRGDDWEVFVARQRGTPYRQLGVNPAGQYASLVVEEEDRPKWDSGATVLSDTSGGDRWTTRLVFPLEKLLSGGAKPGQTMYMNFVRVNWSNGPSVYCWSPTFAGAHAPGRMAEMFLATRVEP